MKKSTKDRNFQIINGVVALAALLIRLISGFQLLRGDGRVATPPEVTDMWTYLHLSREILSGEVPRVFYYQPFY